MRNDWRLLAGVLVAVVALGGSGCAKEDVAQPAVGGGSDVVPATVPAAGSALPHPCELLTAEDAVEVMGPGGVLKRNSEESCIIDGPNRQLGALQVTIEPLPDTWEGAAEMAKSFDNESKPVAVGGGGYTFMGGIIFRKGNQRVSVIGSAYHGPKPKAEAVAYIAQRIAEAR